MRVNQEPVRLGGGHCCACSGVCFHIGPMRLCDRHMSQERRTPGAISAPEGEYTPRERQLIESYEQKVQDLARETLRTSQLTQELAVARKTVENFWAVVAHRSQALNDLAVANAKIEEAWNRIFKDNPELQVNRVSLAMADGIVAVLSRATPEGNNG